MWMVITEYISKEHKHTIQYVLCGYFYIGFIDFMLKGKSLLD